jgi:hypothetical protein
MNAARKEANDIKDRAGKAMMAKNPPVHIYKHSNAAFSVTPGAAKVSARLVKDGGDASVQGGQTTSDAPQS